MTRDKVLMGRPAGPESLAISSPTSAWRWLGWFALSLAIVGIADWLLAWFPLALGNPEWEFGTVVSTFSGLPLITMGFAGLVASAMARGIRWQLVAVGSLMLLWAVLVIGALVIFLLDIPVALRAVQGPARLGILKAIVKTALLGVVFTTVYVIGGIAALRRKPTT